MLGLLQAAGVIALFVLAPGIVVWAQISLVQVIAKLGEVEADQNSFRSRLAGGENAVLAAPRKRRARLLSGDSDANMPVSQGITG
jgi:hypothetical protein